VGAATGPVGSGAIVSIPPSPPPPPRLRATAYAAPPAIAAPATTLRLRRFGSGFLRSL
jgi:hypothetical protein